MLNQDFPPFRDIFGPPAIFRKYSSNWDVATSYDDAVGEGKNTTTKYGSEEGYHKDTAGLIVSKLRNDISLAMQIRTRKLRNLDYVFINHLEPLFYE